VVICIEMYNDFFIILEGILENIFYLIAISDNIRLIDTKYVRFQLILYAKTPSNRINHLMY